MKNLNINSKGFGARFSKLSNSIQLNEKFFAEKYHRASESSSSLSRKHKSKYKHESSLNDDDDDDGSTSPVSMSDDNFALFDEEEEMLKVNKG